MKAILIDTILFFFLEKKNNIVWESVTIALEIILNNMQVNKVKTLEKRKVLQTLKKYICKCMYKLIKSMYQS